MNWKKALAALGVVGLGVVGTQCLGLPCVGAWSSWGMVTDTCPDGEPRLEVRLDGYGIERDRTGTLAIEVDGVWVSEERTQPRSSPFGRFDADLALVVDGQETPVECQDPWDDTRGRLECQIELDADIPDGDHVLRVSVDTPLEDPVVDLELPLYRPSIVHVLTDRPLYESGDTVQCRALVLRAGSLEPIDDRPGTWVVTDPSGDVLLRERSDGGTWGISSSTFPLADDAETGTWSVTYETGDDSGQAMVRVEPFTLPRMTASLGSDDPWNRPGDEVVLRGTVEYASGAPVQGARVALSLRSAGAWPPPRSWESTETVTDEAGNFVWELGQVPDDLDDTTSLSVQAVVTDTDGDTVQAASSLTMSPVPVLAEAVFEVPGGMVPELNNRVYLRVTTPDGRPLPDEDVQLTNRWDPRDEGRTVRTDADGVAALQLDPGQPVSITIPAPPVRPAPIEEIAPFSYSDLVVVHASRVASIQERSDAKAAALSLDDCGHLVFGASTREVALETRSGRVSRALGGADGLGACLTDELIGAPLGVDDGIYELRLTTRVPRTTRLAHQLTFAGDESPSVRRRVEDAVAQAGACISLEALDGQAPFRGLVYATGDRIDVRWQEAGPGTWAGASCVQRAFGGLRPEETLETEHLGVLTLTAKAPSSGTAQRAQPTVRTGFEYDLAIDGIGEGTWRSWPGTAPWLRLRADRVVIDPGDTVVVEILRGPDHGGDLPDEASLMDADGLVLRCPRTAKALKDEPYDDYFDDSCPAPQDDNTVAFVIAGEGFRRIEADGASTVVYATPAATLAIELSTDQATYRPGETATLDVQTGTAAVVSLVGVDSMLGELAPLPGPGELSGLAVGASSSSPAWGTLDALALTSGQVRGENAAMAAVLRVDALTNPTIETPYRSVSAVHQPPIRAEMQTAFWEVLSDLGAAVRAWEATAETDALLSNDDVAAMFEQVLDAREAAGDPVLDPFGRRPRLTTLPSDLLQLCDPRLLVRDATHLPEDVQAWTTFVAEMDR